MAHAVPRSLFPAPAPRRKARPLGEVLPAGRLVEVSGRGPSARSSAAVSLVVHAQGTGELAAWIQPENGPLYPPDLEAAGVDLASLLCIRIPAGDRYGLVRAAELLVRSGAFGLVVIDMTAGTPDGSLRWQGRLVNLLRAHETRLLLLTRTGLEDSSLGPLIGLRIEARRERAGTEYAIHHTVLKAKLPLEAPPELSLRRSPDGAP